VHGIGCPIFVSCQYGGLRVRCHERANQFSGGQATKEWENPLQDLFESYVSDLYKLRESFHVDLTSTARELSQAMDDYSRRSEAELTSFMAWNSKPQRRQGSISFAAFLQPAACRMSMTGRSHLPHPTWMK
jgi:hypothetical protein